MKLYISGPISSDLDGYRAKFADAEARLRAVGYDVVNPAELEEPVWNEPTWLDYMRRDIPALVECDGVATLWDWQTSRGARVEVELAYGLGLPVRMVAHWISEAPKLVGV